MYLTPKISDSSLCLYISYLRPIKNHLCPPPAHIARHCRRFPQGTTSARIRVACGIPTRARTPTAYACARVPPLLPSPADLRPAFLPHHSATRSVVSSHGGQQPCGGTSNNTHTHIAGKLTPSPQRNATQKPDYLTLAHDITAAT